MKKFVVILLALCVVLGCVAAYFAGRNGVTVGKLDSAQTQPDDAQTADAALAGDGEIQVRHIDYDAIRALYAPDEVVGNVDGRDVTWDEYFYWLTDIGSQAEDYIEMMAMYGQSLDWEDKLSADSEQTFAEYVMDLVNDSVREMNTAEIVTGEIGAELGEEDLATLAEQLKNDIADTCGEGAGEEEFNAYLEQKHISRTMYDRLNKMNLLYRNGFKKLYGDHGADVDDETALGYLEENKYVCAAHILFMTIDSTTRDPLDDETIAKKQEQIEQLAAELRAIEDTEELLARFYELAEEYSEDTGREKYPDGYLFTPGTMVTEFEEAVNALEEYEVSEPIKTGFGYHIIIRLPLNPDMPIDYSDEDTPLTARALFANEKYKELMTGRIESSVLTLYGKLKDFNLLDYLK